MRKLLVLACLLIGLTNSSIARAQNTQNICADAGKASTLYCTPILAVENLKVAGSGKIVSPAIPPGFSSLNAALGSQLGQVPTPSPASGFLFSFGASGLSRERDLGPIFSERPATVGRHKLYLEFTYQYFRFDQVDDVPLKQIPLQISGCVPADPACGPFLETSSRLDLKVHQFTGYVTFGVTSRIDLSAAIPVLNVRMGMQSRCSVCTQQQPTGDTLLFTPNTGSGSSSGIGDVTFRAKATALRGEHIGLALGLDVRMPTGDELNYRGSGSVGMRPFVAFGYRARISPHANIGYQANGDSILASTDGQTPRQLPNSLSYTAGADFGIIKSLSVTGDLLGQTFFNADRVVLGVRVGHPDIARQIQNFNTTSFAVGGKFNPAGNLLIAADVLFNLDNNGLHHRPAPMIGISYTF
jgi:Putative MetA-pathway of phenol degradation